jgi:hypothetical protein
MLNLSETSRLQEKHVHPSSSLCGSFLLASPSSPLRVELLQQARHLQDIQEGLVQRLYFTIQELEKFDVKLSVSFSKAVNVSDSTALTSMFSSEISRVVNIYL